MGNGWFAKRPAQLDGLRCHWGPHDHEHEVSRVSARFLQAGKTNVVTMACGNCSQSHICMLNFNSPLHLAPTERFFNCYLNVKSSCAETSNSSPRPCRWLQPTRLSWRNSPRDAQFRSASSSRLCHRQNSQVDEITVDSTALAQPLTPRTNSWMLAQEVDTSSWLQGQAIFAANAQVSTPLRIMASCHEVVLPTPSKVS